MLGYIIIIIIKIKIEFLSYQFIYFGPLHSASL
jgi:hypothetical protein